MGVIYCNDCGFKFGSDSKAAKKCLNCGSLSYSLKEKTASGSKVPCSDGVMRAGGDGNGYIIKLPNEYGYYQRGQISSATDMPLTQQEEVIIKLCEMVLEKWA